jgi:hypothetical protein
MIWRCIVEFGKMIENDDGSVNVDVSLEEDEVQMLIEYAIVNLLKERIEREGKNE